MRDDLKIALCNDFPTLYQTDRVRQNGIAIGNGWEPLLRKLSEKIMLSLATLPEEERATFEVWQVKEKFGALRYYAEPSDITPEIKQAIQEAESVSAITCEICGGPGESYTITDWIHTLCHPCYVQLKVDKGFEVIVCHVCGVTEACENVPDKVESELWYTNLPKGWFIQAGSCNDGGVAVFTCSQECLRRNNRVGFKRKLNRS